VKERYKIQKRREEGVKKENKRWTKGERVKERYNRHKRREGGVKKGNKRWTKG
jgi:hypothetical protein